MNRPNGINLSGYVEVNGNLTLQNGTLTIGANSLSLGGNLSITYGALIGGTTSTLWVVGSAGVLTLPSITLNNLHLNRASGINLNGDLTVYGILSLSSGRIDISSYNLNLGANSQISGSGSASKMIVATSTGKIRKYFSGPSSFVFPVGDNDGTPEYSRLYLSFNSGSFASNAYVEINLKNTKHPNNSSPTHFLKRYWSVSQSGISAFSCSVIGFYVPADVNGTESNLWTGKWNGSSWSLLNQVNTTNHLISGIVNNFSDFTAGEFTDMGGMLPVRTLDLKCLIEGFYDVNTGLMRKPVNITVTLKNASCGVVDSKNVTLATNGTASVDFTVPPLIPYWVEIENWNIVKTTSSTPINLGVLTTYDFTASNAYGNNMTISSPPLIYIGDVNQDGCVDLSDGADIDSDAYNYVSGNTVTDITGDELVDADDIMYWDNNLYNFICEINPC